MNENEIKRLLRAARPNGQDVADADVARAEQAADAALRAQLEEERAFDRAFAAKLCEVPVPDGLKDRLLALEPTEGEIAEQAVPTRDERRAGRRLSKRLVALLAIVVAIGVAVILLVPRAGSGMDLASFRQGALSTFGPGFSVDHATPSVEEVREWLASHGGDASFPMPPGLDGKPPMGCSVVKIDGHEATLICFGLGDGRTAHLFACPSAR